MHLKIGDLEVVQLIMPVTLAATKKGRTHEIGRPGLV